MLDRRSFLAGLFAGVGSAGAAAGGIWAAASRQSPRPEAERAGHLSYADAGEDLVVERLLRDVMRIERPSYVDLGAADPIEANNTYLEYLRGGHGVLVEPNPAYQERLRRCRPRDVIVNAGVGVADIAEADYYVIRGAPMRNTFSKEDVEYLRRTRGGEVVARVIKMRLISINRLIADHLGAAPDLLSSDLEGLDHAVLQTLDFEQFRPAVVVVEARPGDPVTVLLASKGYEMRGASIGNVIFADRRRYVRS